MNKPQPARLVLYWDYDTQWGGDRSRSAGGPKTWGSLEFENTERILEILAEYQWPACFAVVGSAALPGSRPYHDPDQVRRIHAAGHEIASHSHRHEWLPGLHGSALRETLRASRDALEQCIGSSVVSFVPPFNQPFDYPGRLAFSLAERREAGRERTDLKSLCRCLRETGYRFCRVVYKTVFEHLKTRLAGTSVYRPERPTSVAGIQCLRLNNPCGFEKSLHGLMAMAKTPGCFISAYGHPHSLTLGNSQDEKWLRPFMAAASRLRAEGYLLPALPRELVSMPDDGRLRVSGAPADPTTAGASAGSQAFSACSEQPG